MSTHTLIVPPELAGQRLDVALAALLPDTTRSAAARLIAEGRVDLAYGKARASRPVTAGETLTARVAEATPVALAPSPEGLSIVYEDRDVAVVDKPAGLTVHPGAGHAGHAGDTLVNRLLGYDPMIAGAGDAARPGIVHRLDKDTSGLIVVARTPAAHAYLTRQWRDRTVIKRYWALVEGTPKAAEGAIETPIGRDPRNRKRMAPALDGRSARTVYRVDHAYKGFSLLDVLIETGRTHQIRVHLAALGHPVAGDRLYGARRPLPGLTRQFLHAYLLGLRLPSDDAYHEFTAPLPAELLAVLATVSS